MRQAGCYSIEPESKPVMKTRWHMPSDDLDRIVAAYETRPLPDFSTQDFVYKIEWRLYTEWCMNNDWHKHRYYRNDGLIEWLADETHYALHLGYGLIWDKKSNTFIGLTHTGYQAVREAVIGALVDCSQEFILDTIDGNSKCHLRQSLGPYMDRTAPLNDLIK
jgi:hypothetical protein